MKCLNDTEIKTQKKVFSVNFFDAKLIEGKYFKLNQLIWFCDKKKRLFCGVKYQSLWNLFLK